jgi:hypothetical protein
MVSYWEAVSSYVWLTQIKARFGGLIPRSFAAMGSIADERDKCPRRSSRQSR